MIVVQKLKVVYYMLQKILVRVAKKLKEEGITWGIGTSVLLRFYGLIKDPKDIDILVDLSDIERADNLLKNMGIKKGKEKTDLFSTAYFYEYKIENIEINVMAGLIINHDDS